MASACSARYCTGNVIGFGCFPPWRGPDEGRPLLLARPAPLGKDHAAFIGGAAKRTGEFEGFIAFGSGSHLTRKLQRIGCCDFVVQPVTFG
jgi:hypothetical protein